MSFSLKQSSAEHTICKSQEQRRLKQTFLFNKIQLGIGLVICAVIIVSVSKKIVRFER